MTIFVRVRPRCERNTCPPWGIIPGISCDFRKLGDIPQLTKRPVGRSWPAACTPFLLWVGRYMAVNQVANGNLVASKRVTAVGASETTRSDTALRCRIGAVQAEIPLRFNPGPGGGHFPAFVQVRCLASGGSETGLGDNGTYLANIRAIQRRGSSSSKCHPAWGRSGKSVFPASVRCRRKIQIFGEGRSLSRLRQKSRFAGGSAKPLARDLLTIGNRLHEVQPILIENV